MARIRTIKPEFWESQKVGTMTLLSRLTFFGLISLADDDGRGRGEPSFLKGRLHPYAAEITPELVAKSLDEIEESGLVRLYADENGCAYYELPGFKDNQRIDKPTPSKFPPPSKKSSKSPLGVLQESSKSPPRRLLVGKEGKGEEGKGEERITGPSAPMPTELVKPKSKLVRLVEAYKHAKDVPMEDKAWDRANFGRYSKAAKNLLAFFADDLDKSAAYIFLRAEDLNEKNLDWTLETLVRHAYDGLGFPKEEHGREHSEMGETDQLAQRGYRRITHAGEIAMQALPEWKAEIPGDGLGELAGRSDDPGEDR